MQLKNEFLLNFIIFESHYYNLTVQYYFYNKTKL